MQVTGPGPIGGPESVVEPRTPALETQATTPAHAPATSPDEVTITDFARINLLMPPGDGVKLAQLQLAVFSGRYGPPAVTIAEAMIALAVARGLKE